MPSSISENISKPNTMTLIGQGQVTFDPDLAIIRLGVQTTGQNANSTQAENSKVSNAVLQALKQTDIASIKTYQYIIDKVYDFENGNRVDKGYLVRNTLEITTNRLEQVGLIIDTAVNYGANFVELIEFGSSNPDIYYQQALNLAVMNAIQKANSISKQLDIVAKPVILHIIETSSTPFPTSQFRTVQEGGLITPIEPGQKQVNAQVSVEFSF